MDPDRALRRLTELASRVVQGDPEQLEWDRLLTLATELPRPDRVDRLRHAAKKCGQRALSRRHIGRSDIQLRLHRGL